jgi:hypothetical protein
MAKKTTTGNSQKISFGVKKKGKSKRAFGPKEERPKKYRGQGR